MGQSIRQSETWISSVKVEGLHNRLSFELDFQQGINIVYGKNGIGKTTLLHIIANLSEVDIDRFHYLSFKSIIVESSGGSSVRLEKTEGITSVYINDQKTSYDFVGKVDLSDLERQSLRSVVGERATYLPAFRSVLERMREGSYNYEERSTPEFDVLQQIEAQAFRSVRSGERLLRRQVSLIDSNVFKTLRCRQWFGAFVPIIRYPSITDVTSGLNDEWSNAQVAISRGEQRQFEAAFVEIFSAIVKGDTNNDEQDQGRLLDEIKALGSFDEVPVQGPAKLSAYIDLVTIAEQSISSDRNYNKVLEIYRDKLRDRKHEREIVLSPITAFQGSVNEFLSGKLLRIASRMPRPSSNARPSSVFIEPSVGSAYAISALSSGERQIVTMLYSASRSPFRDGCCLIDEPELSLHVDWQRIILNHIERQHQGRQVIACTHSPEVGADHDGRVQFFTPTVVAIGGDDIDQDESSGL